MLICFEDLLNMLIFHFFMILVTIVMYDRPSCACVI